ncbi:MAG: 6-bladed beta-propeller [Candidatus Aminicenantes bacterium]|nr:6-bladed beta-propeller [Candidatus Aminicenantes bacterium]
MNKKAFFIIAMGILLLIFFISCAREKSGWTGTIEEENGVTVVRNPKQPIHTGNVLSFEEELVLRPDAESQELFFNIITAVRVDDAGTIYVLDMGDCQIKVFSKNGEFLRVIGRKGQGPGEMQMPSTMDLAGNERLVVYDMRKSCLSLFSFSGDFIKEYSAAKYFPLVRVRTDQKGHFAIQHHVRDEKIRGYKITLLDSNLEPVREIASVEEKRNPPRVIRLINPYMHYWFTQEGQILMGYSTDYELRFLNLEGDLTKKIITDYSPLPISNEEKRRLTEARFPDSGGGVPEGYKLEFPDHYPPFSSFLIDSVGRIFVRTYEEAGEGMHYYDIFDSEGRYLARVPIYDQVAALKNGKLYTLEEDEEGYQVVKRYHLKWTI